METQQGRSSVEDLEAVPCTLTLNTKTSQLATSTAAAVLPLLFLALSQHFDLLEAALCCGWGWDMSDWNTVCSH